jgi:hypothetical protein
MIDERLIGTWALVATEWKRADGRHANPFGADAIGILTYDAAGNMSAQIMREARPALPEGAHSGIEAAMAAAVPGYIAYFGTYEVVEPGLAVHDVAGSAYPAWVGATHERRYVIEGDALTLMQDFTTVDGVAVSASTTWRRLS